MIRVLLVDDHLLVRAGLKVLLQQMSGVEVVGEAADGLDGLKVAQATQPDLVLMDIAMPGMNGLTAAARLRGEVPRARVILLSMYGTEAHLHLALESGVQGYLLKGAEPEELERAIKTVAEGGTYLTPAVAKFTADLLRQHASGQKSRLDRLSSRQREVLQLMAEGHSTKGIADRLAISVKTVETHRAQLMARLDLYDVASLVRFAMESGLVPPPAC